MLHEEILTPEQVRLLPAVGAFAKDFGLVGGTAVALQIGHRESIDFDLFPKNPTDDFNVRKLRSRFERHAIIGEVISADESELTFKSIGVKVTFFHFNHRIPFTEKFKKIISMPDLLTLAAMKAYALGYRAKWKDYVDLYFIMRDHHKIGEIVVRSKELFPREFSERLFREQISYFERMNYSEPVVFKPGFEVPYEEIKRALVEYSLA